MNQTRNTSEISQHLIMTESGFENWLDENQVSIALTTYQRGRLFFVGRKPEGGIRAHERLIEQCQGLWSDGQELWVSSLYSLHRFQNKLKLGAQTDNGADRLFTPLESRITGRIDVHDMALTASGHQKSLIFVNTAYNCVATISETASFREVWRPSFISKLIGEDRCHLNGMAVRNNKLAFTTAVSQSDVVDGWREKRRDGGVVIDTESQEIIAADLSMPHSPRWYNEKLWVLNSGRGEFGFIDLISGKFVEIAFCPGYARGLSFVGKYAIIGLSRPRNNMTFDGLILDKRLRDKQADARCGLIVVDIETGTTVTWLRFNHTVEELYDVAILQNVRQAEAIGFVGHDIERHVMVEP